MKPVMFGFANWAEGLELTWKRGDKPFHGRRHLPFLPCTEVPDFARAILAWYGSGEKLETAFLFCARTDKQICSKAVGLF